MGERGEQRGSPFSVSGEWIVKADLDRLNQIIVNEARVALPHETMRMSACAGRRYARGRARRARPEDPFSSNRFVRKPGVRISWIGLSGEVRTT